MNTPKRLNYIVYRSATKRNEWDASIKSTITISRPNKNKKKMVETIYKMKATKRETKTKK